MALPWLVVAGALGACWGAVLPGLIARFAVAWPEDEALAPPGDAPARTAAPTVPTGGGPRVRAPIAAGRRYPAGGCWCRSRPWSARCRPPRWARRRHSRPSSCSRPSRCRWPPSTCWCCGCPDPLVGALAGGGLALLGLAAIVDRAGGALLRALAAAAVCAAGYALVALVLRSQLGFGDVKLGAALGLYLGWFGWPAVVAGVVLAPVVNLPLVIGLLVSGRTDRRAAAPFGPAMLAAALAAVTLVGLR